MKLDAQAIALLEDPAHEQALIDLLKRLASPGQMVPPAAHEALEKAHRDGLATERAGYTALVVDRGPARDKHGREIEGARPVTWSVVRDGVIVAAWQPHLIGRRRSA